MPDGTWLSLTPEPERELPAIVAALRAGRRPRPEEVEAERARVAAIVVRGQESDWLDYLSEAVGLVLEPPAGESLDPDDRDRVLDVLGNHHRLLLGLPGDASERTAAERSELERALSGPRPDDPTTNGGP
jgi:hypothetical protein